MSVVVRRVGPEAAADVLAVVRAAFGARPAARPARRRARPRTEATIAAGCCAARRPARHPRRAGRWARVLFKPLPEALYLRRFGVVPDAQGYGVAAGAGRGAPSPPRSATRRVGVAGPRGAARHHRVLGAARLPRDRPARAVRRAALALGPRRSTPPTPRRCATSAARVGAALRAGDLVVLTGELGAGKTDLHPGARRRGSACAAASPRRRSSSPGCTRRWSAGPTSCTSTPTGSAGSTSSTTSTSTPRWTTAVTVVEWGAAWPRGWPSTRLEVAISRAVGRRARDDELDPRRVALRRVVATVTSRRAPRLRHRHPAGHRRPPRRRPGAWPSARSTRADEARRAPRARSSRRCCADAGIVRQDLTAVAVGVGPGPFTGLRVGLVTARTLGTRSTSRSYGVCSLDALALEAVGTGAVAGELPRRHRRPAQGGLPRVVRRRRPPPRGPRRHPAGRGRHRTPRRRRRRAALPRGLPARRSRPTAPERRLAGRGRRRGARRAARPRAALPAPSRRGAPARPASRCLRDRPATVLRARRPPGPRRTSSASVFGADAWDEAGCRAELEGPGRRFVVADDLRLAATPSR